MPLPWIELRGIQSLIGSLRKGTCICYYSGPKKLVEQLHLWCGSLQAGNDSKELKNEIEEILTRLLADHVIMKRSIYLKGTDIPFGNSYRYRRNGMLVVMSLLFSIIGIGMG